MNILVACEESQEVCKELRKRGHRAFSCDIQDCSGGHPEWHIKSDVTKLVNGNCEFDLQNGTKDRQTDRQMGYAYCISSLYTSRRFWSKAFRAEEKGRQTA